MKEKISSFGSEKVLGKFLQSPFKVLDENF